MPPAPNPANLSSRIDHARPLYQKTTDGGTLSTPPQGIHFPLRRPKQPTQISIITQPMIKPTKHSHNTIGTRSRPMECTSSDILRLMDTLCLPVPTDVYASLIKECALTCDSGRALELHAHIKRSGMKLTVNLINWLLLMHVACGHLDTARQMFDQITVRNNFNSWAIIIVAYLSNSQFEEAMRLFVEMLCCGKPISELPSWVMVCILNACACTRNMGLGKQVHGLLLKLDGINDSFLGSSLVNFYGKLGCLEGANFVFDKLSHRNTVIWTAKMVINNGREGHFVEVLKDYKEMRKAGVRQNSFTLSSALRACARIQDGGVCGRQIHVNAIKLGLESDDFVQCGLIDMYGKCGIVKDAKIVFDMIIDKRNAVYWNAMLKGYVQNGFYVEAIKLLYRMEAAGIEVQESLINSVKIACGTSTSENRIEQMHASGGSFCP